MLYFGVKCRNVDFVIAYLGTRISRGLFVPRGKELHLVLDIRLCPAGSTREGVRWPGFATVVRHSQAHPLQFFVTLL